MIESEKIKKNPNYFIEKKMNNQNLTPTVAIIMGSQSDWETMKFSEEILWVYIYCYSYLWW